MAKVMLEVPGNVSLPRDGSIHRAGDIFEFETERHEVKQWLKHGYAREVKKSWKKVASKKVAQNVFGGTQIGPWPGQLWKKGVELLTITIKSPESGDVGPSAST